MVDIPTETFDGEPSIRPPKKINATYKNNPFYKRALTIYEDVKENLSAEGTVNIYYIEELANVILTKYAVYAPLWTNLMGTFVEPNKKFTTISNAPAEGYFHVNKNVTLEGARNVRAADYIRRSNIFVDARLQEINDVYLKDKIDEPKNVNISHWKKIPGRGHKKSPSENEEKYSLAKGM